MVTAPTRRLTVLRGSRSTNYITELLWGLLAMGGALVAGAQSDPAVSIAVSGFGIFALSLLVRRSIALNACLIATLPYAVGSLYGYHADITYYPRPPYDVYAEAAVIQSTSLLLTAALGTVTGVSQRFQDTSSRAVHALLSCDMRKSWTRVYRAALGVSIVMGLHDLLFVVQNYSTLVSSQRHTYGSELWVANGPLGIVVSLVLSAIVLFGSLGMSGRKRHLVALAVLWLPTLLAGGRNYLSVTLVAAIAILLLGFRSRRIKLWVVSSLVIGVWLFTIVPTLWSDNELVWLNEWIMPNSLFLSTYFDYLDPELVGATSFAGQSALLLPSALRPYDVYTFSEVFQALGVTNVGVGGNPWADFAFATAALPWIFAAGTLFIFSIGTMGAKLSPLMPVIIIGLMSFWGRSSFWNVVFLVIYCSVLARMLAPWKKVTRPNNPH